MFLADVSIRRPVFATMLNLVLIVFGLFALPRLPIDQYPNVDFPTITVTVVYPGADPESVEQRILDPLEEAVNGISGLDKMMTTAYPNLGMLVLMFKLEKNSDQASQEVRDKIFAAVGKLPDEAETPIVQKFDIGGAPIINLSLGGEGVPFGELSRLAKDVVGPALERVNGVASVDIAGAREREVHIRVNRERLASFGLTPADVINSVNQQNLDLPAGKIQTETNFWSVRVKGTLSSAEEIGRLPIIAKGAAAGLRILDVAEVKDDIAEETAAAFIGKTPTILLSVQKQAGANTPEIADGQRAAVAKLLPQLPKGVKLEIVNDNSIYIKGSIDSVKLDLVLGAVLATIIVLLFLRDLKITLISAVTLPTAVIGTFAFMEAFGFSLNMMSTLGLSLSIGILIDDAIIVIENIHRHLSMGKSGEKAASDATAEIGLAVLATTLTIGAVFVPVAFMEGIIGRFFFQFGLTVAFAVMISLFVAFTLTPMMSARFLTHEHGDAHGKKGVLARASQAIENFLTRLDNGYRKALGWALNHRWTTLGFGLATFVASILMLKFVPMAFFPKEDRAQLAIDYTLPEGTTLDVSKQKGFEIIDTVQAYPGVDRIITAIAATREAKTNRMRFDVLLVDKSLRSYAQSELVDRLRKDLVPRFAVNGAELSVSESGGGGGGGRQEPLQFIFSSDNWAEMITYTDQIKDFIAKEVSGSADVSTSKPKPQREFRVEIDAPRAADVGVSAAQVGMTLRALFEGDKISDIDVNGIRYDVRLRIDDKDRLGVDDIASVSLTSSRGERISLGAVARITEGDAPSSIERFNGQRQIAVYSNFTGKDMRGASEQINAYIARTMPDGITAVPAGQTEIMATSFQAMVRALFIAILLVFMILCAQYERYLAPLVIMAALPLSLAGAFGSLLITGQVMSIFAMIGIILLMGLVTKNGILLIDFTMQRISEGLSAKDALLEAGPVRLRPILMTTFAAGGGMLPVAIGHGVGGEARSPLGVAVIGGLLMSTLLTLLVVPCLFSLVEDMRDRFAARRQKKKAGLAPVH